MSPWPERCFFVVSWLSQHLSVGKKTKKWKSKALGRVPDQIQLHSKTFLITPNCAQTIYDQTQVRSNTLPIRPNCARTIYDQTQVRSNTLPIRPNCARTIYDQTQVRSNTPMNRLFRPNWRLTRPTPEHGPDCSVLELPSRAYNFDLGT